MQTISRSSFAAVTIEGALLSADVLQRIAGGQDSGGRRSTDYCLTLNMRLKVTIRHCRYKVRGMRRATRASQQVAIGR